MKLFEFAVSFVRNVLIINSVSLTGIGLLRVPLQSVAVSPAHVVLSLAPEALGSAPLMC